MTRTRHARIALASATFAIVLAGLLVLVAIEAGPAPDAGPDGWTVTVTGEVDADAVVPVRALYNGTYDTITREFLFVNEWGTSYTVEFTGVRLRDVLHGSGVVLGAEASGLYFHAADGYSTPLISLQDILVNPDDAIIAFKQSGNWIKPKIEGGDGPVRAVLDHALTQPGANSVFWAKHVTQIIIARE